MLNAQIKIQMNKSKNSSKDDISISSTEPVHEEKDGGKSMSDKGQASNSSKSAPETKHPEVVQCDLKPPESAEGMARKDRLESNEEGGGVTVDDLTGELSSIMSHDMKDVQARGSHENAPQNEEGAHAGNGNPIRPGVGRKARTASEWKPTIRQHKADDEGLRNQAGKRNMSESSKEHIEMLAQPKSPRINKGTDNDSPIDASAEDLKRKFKALIASAPPNMSKSMIYERVKARLTAINNAFPEEILNELMNSDNEYIISLIFDDTGASLVDKLLSIAREKQARAFMQDAKHRNAEATAALEQAEQVVQRTEMNAHHAHNEARRREEVVREEAQKARNDESDRVRTEIDELRNLAEKRHADQQSELTKQAQDIISEKERQLRETQRVAFEQQQTIDGLNAALKQSQAVQQSSEQLRRDDDVASLMRQMSDTISNAQATIQVLQQQLDIRTRDVERLAEKLQKQEESQDAKTIDMAKIHSKEMKELKKSIIKEMSKQSAVVTTTRTSNSSSSRTAQNDRKGNQSHGSKDLKDNANNKYKPNSSSNDPPDPPGPPDRDNDGDGDGEDDEDDDEEEENVEEDEQEEEEEEEDQEEEWEEVNDEVRLSSKSKAKAKPKAKTKPKAKAMSSGGPSKDPDDDDDWPEDGGDEDDDDDDGEDGKAHFWKNGKKIKYSQDDINAQMIKLIKSISGGKDKVKQQEKIYGFPKELPNPRTLRRWKLAAVQAVAEAAGTKEAVKWMNAIE